jgi:hypothetical protein
MFDSSAFFSRLSETLEAGEPVACDVLRVVPLSAPAEGPALATLARALRRGDAELTEVGDSGRVPDVLVKNKGDAPLLLLDGEEILGAKQNRVFNTSILVAAKSELKVPVSCVEAGRWHKRSHGFGTAERVLPASMRKSKSERVTRSLRNSGCADADQQAVWREVAAYSEARAVPSPTSALADVYEADASHKERYRKAMPAPRAGQTGMAVWVRGRLAALDVLGRPEAFEEAYERLLHAAIAEALLATEEAAAGDPTGKPSTGAEARDELRELLGALGAGVASEHRGTGLGRDVRVSGRGGRGNASVLLDGDGGLVHLQAFGG